MAKALWGQSILTGILGPGGKVRAERLQRNIEELRKAQEVCVKFEVCPRCNYEEFNHIRGKVHCLRCHATIETCCD